MAASGGSKLEVWGGLECTIARVRGRWRDQFAETGHRGRIGDLDLVAGLGVRTLRYPVLWEAVSPRNPEEADWSWHDARLARLRELGIAPIIGLLHHGSGPAYTELLDRELGVKLARHAEAVARRYPWVESFTPVNEPLTTARFSGLYGHWYPHHRDVRSLMRALVNQCWAVVLSMRAIRRIIPHARLVQTEDLGKAFSTPLLAYQADYENSRRWLTFDLLTGRVTPDHPLHDHLLENGIEEAELRAFTEDPCPPDVVGINHYPTSERFLEHRREHVRGRRTGSNGRHRYADLEAVRMDLGEGATGPEPRLREAWERYNLPIAITEAHHGCSRDEQVRWLGEVWAAATKLRADGADIRAMTVWALFGAVDWSSLLTRENGHYEPGAFDVRSSPPRLTALGRATQELATSGTFSHPVLDSPGWWRMPQRLYRPSIGKIARLPVRARPVLIVGSEGRLGAVVRRIADHRGLSNIALSQRDLDAADSGAVSAALDGHRPWAVVNCSGFSEVSLAEASRESCFRSNSIAPHVLAKACAARGISLLSFSSHRVFSGPCEGARTERDPVSPHGVYAQSKAEGEARALQAHPEGLVVRAGPLFDPHDDDNFVLSVTRALVRGEVFYACAETRISPSYAPDLAHAALDLLVDRESGLWHLANTGDLSWLELARRVAKLGGFDPHMVQPCREGGDIDVTALASERGSIMPALDSALNRYFRDCEVPARHDLDVIAAE